MNLNAIIHTTLQNLWNSSRNNMRRTFVSSIQLLFLLLFLSLYLRCCGLCIRIHSEWLKSVRLANDSIHYKLIVLLAKPIPFYPISFLPRPVCHFSERFLGRVWVVKI